VAALSAIAAAWAIREPPTIVAGLADVLVGSLGVDFAFFALKTHLGDEMTRASSTEITH
jgi:hypothetical protein